MSGWIIALRELDRLGGGPLASAKFDRLGPCQKPALARLLELELVTRSGVKSRSKYTLTEAGKAYLAGELVEVKPKRYSYVGLVLDEPDDDMIEGALLEGGASVGSVTPDSLRHLAKAMFELGRNSVSQQAA